MKKCLVTLLFCALILTLAACGGSGASSTSGGNDSTEPAMVVNTEKKEVIIPAEVNGKYFTESTRHGVVYAQGGNGEKSVLRGLSDEKELYHALVEIGATPGNNVTMDHMGAKSSAEGVAVDGSKLNVFVIWEGSGGEVPFSDIIKASEERPMDIRFGGNLEDAQAKNTGCILCLDSCAVGITSNAAYPTGTTQANEVQFYGNDEVLPVDGTAVSVIFRLAE